MTVACPHFDVSIRQRSKGQSAVAGAAYMSAEKLFSEYDQRTKNFCYKEKEIVAKGILLPPNAPREYTDRQTLWNAVEASERQWNAQLARGIIMALPRELPADQYESLVREYCMEQFVSRGMIVREDTVSIRLKLFERIKNFVIHNTPQTICFDSHSFSKAVESLGNTICKSHICQMVHFLPQCLNSIFYR